MDRLIRLVLDLMPPGLQDLAKAAGLDVEATCRLQPLAELLGLARKHRGWSSLQAAKSTGVRRRTIDAAESANPSRIDATELIAYTARLGVLHLLGEWVAANPRLAKAMGFPKELLVLEQGRQVMAEDARHANLLPDALRVAAPRRFEAPADFSQHLDPDRAEERLEQFLLQTASGASPDTSPLGPGPLLPNSNSWSKPKTTRSAPALLELRVSLQTIEPRIWRRLVVPNDLSFLRLHDVLQIAMGWTNSHLHAFRWRDLEIGVPDPEWTEPVIDGAITTLADLGLRRRSRFQYAYDFGDDWIHDVVVEKIRPYTKQFVPVCLEGARACPPEDCGGPYAYAGFVQAIADPAHPEHESIREWVGPKWTPETFDLEDVNRRLGKLAARWYRPRRSSKSR